MSKPVLFSAALLFALLSLHEAHAQFGQPQWGQPMQNAAPQFPGQQQNAFQQMYQQQQAQQQLQLQMQQRNQQLQQQLFQQQNPQKCALVGNVVVCR